MISKSKNGSTLSSALGAVIVAAVVSVVLVQASPAAPAKQTTFVAAWTAVRTAVSAAKSGDQKQLAAIFGPAAKELLFSGDAVADKQARERFVQLYEEKHSLVPAGAGMVLVIGTQEWPFPIPLAKKGKVWFFDTNKGKEEILTRRIGQNELSAIQVCLAIVDAQRQYVMSDRNDDGFREYAQKFRSDSGKKNGLYWKTGKGEEPSPLGPFAAQASSEGYEIKQSGGKPSPYHGYYYRILKAQGKSALGGAFDYVVDGHMVGGFAVVAYPAEYGNSGVMSFIVNQDGVVYQKNLGQNTGKVAEAMKVYDPDPSWKKAQ